jgi:hypothetical protein
VTSGSLMRTGRGPVLARLKLLDPF